MSARTPQPIPASQMPQPRLRHEGGGTGRQVPSSYRNTVGDPRSIGATLNNGGGLAMARLLNSYFHSWSRSLLWSWSWSPQYSWSLLLWYSSLLFVELVVMVVVMGVVVFYQSLSVKLTCRAVRFVLRRVRPRGTERLPRPVPGRRQGCDRSRRRPRPRHPTQPLVAHLRAAEQVRCPSRRPSAHPRAELEMAAV